MFVWNNKRPTSTDYISKKLVKSVGRGGGEAGARARRVALQVSASPLSTLGSGLTRELKAY